MFQFQNGQLKCEELVLRQLAEDIKAKFNDFATPFYVYSQKQIQGNINAYKKASLFIHLHIMFCVSFVLLNFVFMCAHNKLQF